MAKVKPPSIIEQGDMLLTVDDLARFLRITAHAVHMQRWRDQPPGNLGFRVGARVLFRPDQITAWLDKVQTEQARDLDA